MGTASETGIGATGGAARTGNGAAPAIRSGTGAPRVRRAAQAIRRRTDAVGERMDAESVAKFLGWFSVGLGLAELVAPGALARLIGVRDDSRNRTILRGYGVRELTAGVGILTKPDSAGWVWSRVVGDAIDLATLGRALSSDDTERGRAGAATAAVLGVTALDVLCATQLSRSGEAEAGGEPEPDVVTRRSITIGADQADVYAFWRDFRNLPRFMRHLESVEVTGDRTSHWVAKGPGGKTFEWDAEMTEDRPNELIAWRSLENADVRNAGTVRFVPAPQGQGTEVRVELEYDPPGGALAAKVAALVHREPGQQVQDDLRRLKQVMEIGEVVVSDASRTPGPHPARPAEPDDWE